MMSNLLHVSSSPHIRSKITTDWIMYMVLIALLPATCMGVYLFGSSGSDPDRLFCGNLCGNRIYL